MNTPEMFEGMAEKLVLRGLPAEYAQRAVAEFADHHRDLVEELQAGGCSEFHAAEEANRRLGDAHTLLKKTVRGYQRRHWSARWPLLTFLLGPIPLLIVVWMAMALALYCVGAPLEKAGLISQHLPDGEISTGEWAAERLGLLLCCFVSPAITIYLLSKLLNRAALNWKWLAISACVMGLTIGMVRCGFAEPSLHATTMDGKPLPADVGVLNIGFPLFAPTWLAALKWYTRDLQQICQVLLPLGMVTILALRAKRMAHQASRLVSISG